MEPLETPPVLVCLERHCHLVAKRGVPQRCHRGGMAAVNPTLLERPQGRDDEVVGPRGGVTT